MSYRIDLDNAAFIQAGQSITVAAANAHLRPSVAKAVACRVGAAGDELRLVLVRSRAAALLQDIAASWRLAVMVSQPSTHRSLQLKGRVLAIEPVAADELPDIQRQMDHFASDLRLIGHVAQFAPTFLAFDRDDLLGIRVSVESGFHQTPGPGAGRRLDAGA